MTITLHGTNGVTTDGITLGSTAIASTGAEINILDGVTATATEINYIDGVTSNIQTQLGTKMPLAGGTFTGNITRGGTVITDGSITDTGDFTIDVAGDIILDAAGDDILLKSAGTHEGNINLASSNLTFKSIVSDKDMIFQGNDGGSGITALTLDMSAAGLAIFNAGIALGGSGAANTLDDYEEGVVDTENLTFSTSGTATTQANYRELRYTKVGSAVTLTGNIFIGSVSSQNGFLKIPLPFANGTGEKNRTAGSVANLQSNTPTLLKVDSGQSFAGLITSSGFATVTVSANHTYVINLCYNTDA